MKNAKAAVSAEEVQDACRALAASKRPITVRNVKQLLGRGHAAELVTQVLLYKSQQETLLIAPTPEPSPNTKLEPKALTRTSTDLSTALVELLSNALGWSESSFPWRNQVQALVAEHCAALVANMDAINLRLEHRLADLETQLLHYQLRLKELEQLPRAPRLTVSTGINSQLLASNEAAANNELYLQQLNNLPGFRRATYNKYLGQIILVCDYNTRLHKELLAGKRGKLDASSCYLPHKYWELTDFTINTIKFLLANNFTIAPQLQEQLAKLTKASATMEPVPPRK